MNSQLPVMWQEQDVGAGGPQLDIKQMWLSIYRHKWSILALGAVCTLIAVLYSNTLTPIYQASGTLLIEAEEANIVSIQDMYSTGYRGYEYRQTQFELLRSRNLAERVVRKLELHKDPRFPPPPQTETSTGTSVPDWLDLSFLKPVQTRQTSGLVTLSPEQLEEKHIANLTSMVAGGVVITPIADSQLVTLSYRSPDPEFAAQVVNTLAQEYIESYLDARLNATRTASTWLTERLVDLKENLALAEQRLQEFTERENLVDLQGISTLGARQIADLSEKYAAAREKRLTAETIRGELQRLGTKSTADYLTMSAIQRHELVGSLKSIEAEAQRKVDELSKRYGVKHPKMIAARSELKSVQDNLTAEVGKVIAGIDREYQLALRTEQSLYEQLEAAKAEYRDVNRMDFQLKELQREVDTSRQLYDLFFTRMKETNQAGGFEKANARVVDAALVPSSPVSPNTRMIITAGMAGGILFGMGIAVLLGMLDNTVKIPEDVETKLKAKQLGTLPLQKADKEGRFENYWENHQSGYAEAVRTIRTAVVLSGLDKPLKILVVTSTLPNEGKSAVSLNLGAAFAHMEKTLVIGADLRRPTLAAKCGLAPKHPGLSNYVAGSAELDECIVQFGEQGLFVMPAGLIPTNPLEMLSSRKFREALEQLEEKFDRIIIDSAPVQAVSDALILATYADATVYVVSADSTSATMARRGLERVAATATPIAGVVLNRFNVDKAKKYYGGSHYAYDPYYQADEEVYARR